MGKNNRQQIQYRDSVHNVDINADSVEECDFLDWLAEAVQLGLVNDFTYQPPSIKLSNSVEYLNIDGKKRVLMREHVYSPDFMLTFVPGVSRTLCKEFKLSVQQMRQEQFQVYLDVKGTFQKSDGGRSFSINQKWVYQRTGIYVLKLVPKDFFMKCGCPLTCFKTRKTGKPRAMFKGYKTLQETFAEDIKKKAAE